METARLIHTCEELGAVLTPDGAQLRVKGWSKLSRGLQEALRDHKIEILACLLQLDARADEKSLNLEVREPSIPIARDLLAWAWELAEQDLTMPEKITYEEGASRLITTNRVSYYAALYLREISYARNMRQSGGWGRLTPEWSRKQEEVAIGGLQALRDALESWQSAKGGGRD